MLHSHRIEWCQMYLAHVPQTENFFYVAVNWCARDRVINDNQKKKLMSFLTKWWNVLLKMQSGVKMKLNLPVDKQIFPIKSIFQHYAFCCFKYGMFVKFILILQDNIMVTAITHLHFICTCLIQLTKLELCLYL